jgi:hypothetical protein
MEIDMNKIIELSSDSKGQHDGIQNNNDTVSTLLEEPQQVSVGPLAEYSLAIEGKPVAMPHPTFMTWIHGTKLLRHVVQ